MDFRVKPADHPYPSELVVYLNNHDVELSVNPNHISPDSISFGNDPENPTYLVFMRENQQKREQLGLVEQLLAGYQQRSTRLYQMAIREFEKRKQEYNSWIDEQIQDKKSLFVSHLFQFQKISYQDWKLKEAEMLEQKTHNIFSMIDLTDTLVLRTEAMNQLMNGYMGLYSIRANTELLRDSLFTVAGEIACKLASKGHPKVYGWMVDYFYRGYESANIPSGMAMLEQFINDPRCLTSKKAEITRRLQGMKTMTIGSKMPQFGAEMLDGMPIRFDGVSKQKVYELIVFYESDCSHCKDLMQKLDVWYRVPENRMMFDIITIGLDNDRVKWENNCKQQKFDWLNVWAKGGINSKAATDYFILSSPVMFVADKNMKLVATPNTIEELNKFVNQ